MKSGTDFRHFSHITLRIIDGKPVVDQQLIEVTTDYGEDEELKLKLERFSSKNSYILLITR